MVNIINQIIEIDGIAQKRLNEANEIKNQYLNELQEKTVAVNQELEKEAKIRIDKVLVAETKLADEEKARISKETAQVIARLEETYSKNHNKLEQDIFNAVISS